MTETYNPITFPVEDALLDSSGDKYLTTDNKLNYISQE